MDKADNLNGIMKGGYGDNRLKRPELTFRYRVRAAMAARAVKKYHNTAGRLRVLDFGSADGLTLVELKRLLPAGEYTGIEYSDELIEKAALLPPGIKIIKGKVTDLPAEIENNGYDLVCALALLEHLDDPRQAVKEAGRALKPGGLFVATCPHPFWDRLSSKLSLLKSEEHVQRLGKKSLYELFADTDMRVLAYEKFMFAPISFLPYLNLRLSPRLAIFLDSMVKKIKIFDWLFVNQCVIAKKQ